MTPHWSQLHLSDLVFRKEVRVEWSKRDRYGRLVGQVWVDDRDANLAQLEAGLAWHYVAYAREQRATDREAYALAELKAREARLGLWRDPDQVAPWVFRHPVAEPR